MTCHHCTKIDILFHGNMLVSAAKLGWWLGMGRAPYFCSTTCNYFVWILIHKTQGKHVSNRCFWLCSASTSRRVYEMSKPNRAHNHFHIIFGAHMYIIFNIMVNIYFSLNDYIHSLPSHPLIMLDIEPKTITKFWEHCPLPLTPTCLRCHNQPKTRVCVFFF